MFKIGMWILVIYTIVFNIVIAVSDDEYYGVSYNDYCFKRNVFAWLPLIVSVLILGGSFIFGSFDTVVASFFLMFFSMPVCAASSIHCSKHNQRIGEFCGETDSERYQKEQNNERYGKIAATGSAYSIYKHGKKAVKDLTDVDNWKEFK